MGSNMQPSRTCRLVGIAAAAALAGLVVAACGDSNESTGTAARTAPAVAATVAPTAAARETARAASPTVAPQAEPTDTPATAAAGAPGARPGGAGFLGGRFGGTGLAEAVAAAVAEATGKPVEEVHALQESGMTLAEVIEAEDIDREAIVAQAVDEILANLPGGRGGQTGGAGAAGAGAGGGGFGGGAAGGGFDPRAALRNAVDALIDGETRAPPEGARQFVGMGQAITDVVAERTGRTLNEVREARAGGQSFASLLFVAGQDVDAAIDAIVETIQTNAGAAERPEGAPALPAGEDLREAVEAIMYATDDSEAELTPPAAPGT